MVSKILNKICFFFIVFSISVILNLIIQMDSNAACAKNASDAIKVKAGDSTPFALDSAPTTFDQDQCSQEPDEYKVKFYKVALCLTDPYTGESNPDYSSCADILNTENEVILKPDADTDLLDGNVFLPVGSYNHLAVIVDNHLNLKHKQKFVLSNGNDATLKGNSSGSGTWCWSRAAVTTYSGGRATDTDYEANQNGVNIVASGTGTTNAQLKCGSEPSASDIGWATEIIDTFADNTDYQSFSNYSADEEIDGIQIAGNLLKTDNKTLATTDDDARRIAGFYKYTTPVVINEDTVMFKVKINTYSSVSIDFAVDGSNVIWGAKMGADPFIVKIETNLR